MTSAGGLAYCYCLVLTVVRTVYICIRYINVYFISQCAFTSASSLDVFSRTKLSHSLDVFSCIKLYIVKVVQSSVNVHELLCSLVSQPVFVPT